MAELRLRRDEASNADLVELRLDTVADPNVAGALAGRRTPVIVTCRPPQEGGHFAGSEEERKRLLTEALALGAEYVDLEWRAGFDDLIQQTGGRRIVLSMHDFTGVAADLPERVRAMCSTGAQVVKAAAKMNRLEDCLALLAIGQQAGLDGGLVLAGLGPRGIATRVLASRFRSLWSYAGELGDIGQITPALLLSEFGFRGISDSTAVYGIVGSPVGHSVSPAMHNAALRATRRNAVYLPLDAADADDFVSFARGIGLAGASITIPFKRALFERMDECDPVARRIGAINTIKVENGRWIGSNTDASGFIEPLRARMPLAGARASILGAGGAARAAAIALTSSGADVTVHARNPETAAPVALIASARVGPWPPERGTWDLLVNCTPVGMYPNVDETPLPADRLATGVVYDLVYNPSPTRLLREAAASGCQTIGGLEMLVAQAQEQFQWWVDAKPPAGVMRAAAVRRLAAFGVAAEEDRSQPGYL
jgi:3-dehydroquinate dehydratase / shikimate dehydrogenase